tara:strand:+ start:7173 stop:7682 length:510 start_codon:yes stop_codon:yes gene_type:complete
MPQLNFNPADHPTDESMSFDPLPDGWYDVRIDGTDLKPTKANNGEYLEIQMTVLGGQFANRKLWDRLTLKHPNETTTAIAARTLGDICRAVNITALQQTEELHGKPVRIRLKIKQDSTWGPRNEVQAYEASTGAATPPTTGAATTSAPGGVNTPTPTPTAAADVPPWKR